MESSDILAGQKEIIKDSVLGEISDVLTEKTSHDGIFPDDFRELLQEAEDCLNLSCECARLPLQWFDIAELGCPADLNAAEREEYFSRLTAELSAAFAGTQRAFGLRWSSWDGAAFSVGLSGGGEELAGAVLRGSCRHSVVRAHSGGEPPRKAFTAEASCSVTFMDTDSSEQAFPRKEACSWPDKTASALPGRKYSVEIRFDCPDEKFLRRQLEKINVLAGQLASLQETSLQVSGNAGSSTATTGNITQEMLRTAAGSIRENPSYGMSAAYSRTIYSPDAEYMSDKLKFCAARVNQMLRCGAHAVSITAAAENEADLQALQTVLSGAVSVSGLSLTWHIKPESSRAVILPDHALSLIFSVPSRDFPGFAVQELENYNINIHSEKPALKFGNVVWNGQILPDLLSIPLKEINRHVFVCGMTGSGKTNSVCRLLAETDMPFLVIEPVKGEYRSLCSSAGRRTEICTMDISTDEVCPVNPLWFPAGGSLQYHIDSIKTIIASAFDLYAAMPNILEQCLIRTYVRSGWNIVTGHNVFEGKLPDDKLYPTLSDLCAEIGDYLNKSSFQGETKENYKGALLSRLQSFTSGAKGMLLNQQAHIDFSRIIRDGSNIILELDAIADDSDKSIVMGTVLAQYFQCVKLQTRRIQGGLRHITVLEEAHHIFAESAQESSGSDARRRLSESLSNMLAEIRAYGEGIIIVDQSPSRISPEVIKNTAVKIIHRVDYGKDLELLRNALLLREGDTSAARLLTGQALVRFGGMSSPAVIAVPLSESKEGFSPAKSTGPTLESLIQSSADIIMGSESFASGLAESCRLFVNQALFDGLDGIQASMPMLSAQVSKLIYLHGYKELVRSSSESKIAVRLVMSGIRSLLRQDYAGQKYLCDTAEMFIERIVAMSDGIRDKEWELLSDYRSARLHPKLSEFCANTDNAVYSRLRAVSGNSRYIGLAACILPEFKKLLADGAISDYALKKCLAGCFYVLPEQTVIDMVSLLVNQYTSVTKNV